MILFDRGEYPGGLEIRLLLTPLAQELIRAGVMIAGVLLIFLTVYLL